DIGGATALKTYTAQLVKAEERGYKAKGIFLVGIPGTGKTFFPKCFAGELRRRLIALNLSQIMESDEPITKLNGIFEYLHQRKIDYPDEKFVILIDEIEKMIGNASAKEKQMLGRLLTILNDINTPACEYSFNAIFFATANDLGSILENNPEFLRRGRWDELFFINLPTHEYAIEMFEIYFKKYKLDFVLDLMSLDEIFAEIEHHYQKDNPISNRFPYTPAEIENFCKRLDFVKKAEDENFKKEHILESIEMIIPLGKSARKGIEKMNAQRELFIEI
ncbi:ATP-binding protein, partial [Campylobacter upsaliensis]|nr:ATP-binding protein [Campylobacter upsaliensis]